MFLSCSSFKLGSYSEARPSFYGDLRAIPQTDKGGTEMMDTWKGYAKRGRFGLLALGVVVLSVLLLGFTMTSDSDRTVNPRDEGAGGLTRLSSEATVIPDSFAPLAEELAPTVVNIKVIKVDKIGGHQWFNAPEGPFGDFSKRFFKELPKVPDQFEARGAGSGVIISNDGTILTNNHVVEGAKEVMVTLADKGEYEARVVGRDPKTDLAVLKIESDQVLPSVSMGDSDQLKVGDWVLAIGNPFGLSHTVTSGIVSAKGRVIGAGPYDDFIQTDASINPGNSGGPLFDMSGKLIGINTAIIPYGQGIGFAIPINTAKPLIPQLVSKGEVTRGYLGVSIQSITPDLARAMDLEDRRGALVAAVMSGSPAEKAGIRRGDVIVRFDDKAVGEARDLSAMVARSSVGKETNVGVIRNGEEMQLPVKVGQLKSREPKIEASAEPARGKWGFRMQDVTPLVAEQLGLEADEGVAVVDVEHGSPAHEAGIRRGDVILEVNRQEVKSVEDLKEAIEGAKDQDSLLLLVERDDDSFFVVLTG
jgi:serine protease Do